MAQLSSIMTSGSSPPCRINCLMNCFRTCGGNLAKRGSSSLIWGAGTASSRAPEYHGRFVVSVRETTNDNALVVGTLKKCIASRR